MTSLIYSTLLALVLSLTALPANAAPQERGVGRKVAQNAVSQARATNHSVNDQFKNEIEDASKELAEARQKRTAENAAQRLERLKKLGAKLIDVRIKVITNQEQRVSNGKCSNEVEVVVKDSLATLKASLEAKKTELEAATTAEQARTIIRAAVDDTKVFSIWVPATRQLCVSSRLLTLINGRLTDILQKMEDAGLDVSAIETKLNQAKEKTEQAYEVFESVVKNPKATDAKSKVNQGKDLLQEVRKLLGDIKSDIGNLRGEYNKATKGDSEETGSTTESNTDETTTN